MCRSLKTFFSRDVILLCVAVALLVVTLIPAMAHAQYVANRPTLAMAGGATDTLEVSAATARELPSGYVAYSSDGSAFWLQPFATITALDPVPTKVPENQPITFSAPRALRVGNTWNHWIIVNATLVAATDSVFFLPLDK